MSHPSRRYWKIRNIRTCAGPGGACRFAVTLERGDDCISDLKLDADELLDYTAFQAQILRTTGRLIRLTGVEDAADPTIAWLDLVEASLPDESVRRPSMGFCPSPPPVRYQAPDGVFQEIGGGD
ncbi:MAG TPA: hypothetical protein VMS17_20435 [Gemmataceae bacterium]|nr:hypothetical protein [Gemmataceae bacterium]